MIRVVRHNEGLKELLKQLWNSSMAGLPALFYALRYLQNLLKLNESNELNLRNYYLINYFWELYA